MEESGTSAQPISGESPARNSKGNARDFYMLQEQLGLGQPNNNEQDYFPSVDPYFDEHEEINDLQALSEIVPNILEDNKVGWRMTSTNDECWKSDEHLLESKFKDACPAMIRLLKKQVQEKNENLEPQNAELVLIEDNEMGEEVGLEVGLEEISGSKLIITTKESEDNNVAKLNENCEKNEESGIAVDNTEHEDLKTVDKASELRQSEVVDTADIPKSEEDTESGEGEDKFKEESNTKKLESDGVASTEQKIELNRSLTQDLGDLEYEGGHRHSAIALDNEGKNDETEKEEESKAQLDDLASPEDEVKTTETPKGVSSNQADDDVPEPRAEEKPAPPTIVTRMKLSLPSFKPATGCSNASDFIVRCFVARLRSGVTVVKHGRSRWCKSRLRILHVHPDGSSLSWKPAIGEPTSSKRPPKLDLASCLEVRHAWSSDPVHPNYTGTSILRSKCETVNAHKSFSLIFPRRTVDITAITADQCKVLMEGFSALCFRLQVANLSARKKHDEDEKVSLPTSTGTCASNRQVNIIHVEGA